ncbi:MAG: winged helix-turn-helix domain-containing protein [Saprospiraceae bacterium]
MQKINLKTARQFIISNQFDFGKNSTTHEIIQHLGYVQIDTISVIQRTHHHVLWTRNPKYQIGEIQKLVKEKKVFDYWAHAASYLPIEDFRFSLIRKSQVGEGDGFWYEKNPKNMKFVLDRIKAEGPLMSRDFKKAKIKSDIPWIKSPINQAIMQLFSEGKIMIVERQGFQKKYDLSERAISKSVNTKMPTEKEYLKYLIKRDLRAHGLKKAREIGYLLKIDRKELKNILEKMVKSGELEANEIKDMEGETYFSLPNALEDFSNKKTKKEFHILSPFDNILIQRKRVKEIFGFEYLLECYVPEAKRKVGYFSLPLLYGNEFIGQIDLKADRKKKQLLIRNLVWEKEVKKSDVMRNAFRKKLNQLMQFNNCEELVLEKKAKMAGGEFLITI